MDVTLDASFVLPALLFTFLAVILASSLLSRKRAPRRQAESADECPAEERTGQEGVPPHEEGSQAAEDVKAPAVARRDPGEQLGAPVVEDVGAVEEEPLGEAEIQQPPDVFPAQDIVEKPVSAPAPKEEPAPEPMLAPVPESSSPPEPEKEVNTQSIPTAGPEPEFGSESTRPATPDSQNLSGNTTKSMSEPGPEQIPKSSQLPLQETPAENSPVKESIVRSDDVAAPPSQEEEDDLKYVPGKLRTSQFEKLMTKEELEEEQRVQREQLAAIFQLLRDNKDTFGEVTEADVEEQLKLYSI